MFSKGFNKGQCGKLKVNEHNYCSMHKNTVQAKKHIQSLKNEGLKKPPPTKPEPKCDNIKISSPKRLEITVHINKWGNYQEEKTNFCFDRWTKKVIGVQGMNGELYALNKKDLKLCDKYGWEVSSYEEETESSDSEESDTENKSEDTESEESNSDTEDVKSSEEESELVEEDKDDWF